jgi:putative DNA primase/helicase
MFLPLFTIWLTANSRSIISNPNAGIWQRIREIPFEEVIPEHERDLELKRKLCEEPENRTGILNWLVQGCLTWQKEGLAVPKAVRKATDDYKEEMNSISQFLNECTIISIGYLAKSADMSSTYTQWCKQNNIQRLGSKNFTQSLKDRGLERGAAVIGTGKISKSRVNIAQKCKSHYTQGTIVAQSVYKVGT